MSNGHLKHRNTDQVLWNTSAQSIFYTAPSDRPSTTASSSRLEFESSLFVSAMYQDDVLLLSLDLDFEDMLHDLDENLNFRKSTSWSKSLVMEFKNKCQRLMENKEKLKSIQNDQNRISSAYKAIAKKEKNSSLSKEEAAKQRAVLKDQGRQLKDHHNHIIADFHTLEQEVLYHALKIPNHLHKDTPTVDEVKELKTHGCPEKIKISKEKLQSALRKCVKFSNIGQRSYYLMSDAALKEQELIRKMSSDLRVAGFTHMVCPEIFRTVPIEGAGISPLNPKEVYHLEVQETNKGKAHILPYKEYIRGTSVVPFLAYFTKHLVASDDLPRKFYTIGRSYDVEQERNPLPGLYGAPQNICAEVAAMTKNSLQNEVMYDELQATLWSCLMAVDIPTRMVLVPAHSLHCSERKRTEIQFWSPSLQQYVQVGTLSCYGDFFSRRLMFRQSQDINKHHVSKSTPIYTIHGRWANITRLVVLHLEYSCQFPNNG